MGNGPTDQDYLVHYQLADHAIWWAKGQLWTATNWALALLALVVGTATALREPFRWAETWPFVLLALGVAAGASWYLTRLHYDAARARQNNEHIRNRVRGLAAVYESLPQHGKPQEDASRGVEFVVVLLLVIAVGFGLAVHLLTRSASSSITAALVLWLVAVVALSLCVRRANRERANHRKTCEKCQGHKTTART
jgi:FtsH-binding integral membrane protein